MWDARTFTTVPAEVRTTEVCVIGSGFAGLTAARELSRRGRKVLLLESGGAAPEPICDDLNRGDVVGIPIRGVLGEAVPLEQARARVLGGCSDIWGGFSHPLTQFEMDQVPNPALGAWPIDRVDLDPWYEVAHDYLNLGPFDYDVTSWASRAGTPLPPALGDGLEYRVIQKNRIDFGATHLPAIEADPNITVVQHATVVRLDSNQAGNRIRALTVRSHGGPQFEVRTTAVVVATGGIEVARLLLASNDILPAGVGNQNDQVGRYFAEHLSGSLVFLYLTGDLYRYRFACPGVNTVATTTPDGRPTDVQVFGAVSVTDEARTELGLPGFNLEGIFQFTDSLPEQVSGLGGEQVTGWMAETGQSPATGLCIARPFVQSIPDPNSRIRLTNQTDALGMPRLALDWRVDPRDEAGRRSAVAFVTSRMATAGTGYLQDALGWVTPIPNDPGADLADHLRITPTGDVSPMVHESVFHPMGTTRMSDDPTVGVVDRNCRVHGFSNLYIASSSTFSTPVGYHPTLTVVALAARIAHHIDSVGLPQ